MQYKLTISTLQPVMIYPEGSQMFHHHANYVMLSQCCTFTCQKSRHQELSENCPNHTYNKKVDMPYLLSTLPMLTCFLTCL